MLPAEFMCDALDDLRDFYMESLAPAPQVPALTHVRERAQARREFLRGHTMCTADRGFLAIVAPDLYALACMLMPEQPAPSRVFTGYMPKAQRKAVDHRLYSDGICKPPRRETLSERVAREAREKWGHA